MRKTKTKQQISRRRFLEGTGVAVVAATAAPAIQAQSPGAVATKIVADPAVPRTTIRETVNGAAQRVEVEDRWTLVELLRDHLQLTGTKIGCDRGECGCCTVLMDGKPVYSCSNLAVWADGRAIQTVEGLARDGHLDPLQQAFMDHDAPQCGFCTSGQLMAAKALVNSNPHPTADEVRAAMTGNLCRCSNYNRYVEATLAATAAAGPPTAARNGSGRKRRAVIEREGGAL
jgi:aerobic-type carbon monoxide dehydrogenase small subunit (CoxS/CutS family)